MKICVYAIAKNEEQFVDRWMDSMREADWVCVLDTGSTDRTVEKLADRGAVVRQEAVRQRLVLQVPWQQQELFTLQEETPRQSSMQQLWQ